MIHNEFLSDLLTLQQDGSHAISAPTNWMTYTPLLEVPTEIDDVLSGLQESLLRRNEDNHTGRWQFLVGSPGNGKSAAIGKLCKQLIESQGCRILDENGVSIADPAASKIDYIPYILFVYEGNNRFESVQIVQDASVVRNPSAPDADPAQELLNAVKDAWEKGVSLVVCTNRGVLEKAHRDNHTNPEINNELWFKILAEIVRQKSNPSGVLETPYKFNGRKPRFQDVRVGYYTLDNRSLLCGKDTFNQLLLKAINFEDWDQCNQCPVQAMCPFKSNHDWLLDENGRGNLLKLLTRAEVLSSQVIVFREALAIISLILAGCPRDYISLHPCDWVKAKVDNGDIFSLATRRIYMCLFAPHSPHGLETAEKLRIKQIDAFRSLLKDEDQSNTQSIVSIALGHVIDGHHPSTDVGVSRLLLGETGIIALLDPCRDTLPHDYYEEWDEDYRTILNSACPVFTDIERTCLSIWIKMEDNLEMAASFSAPETHWALRRWSSNFLLHLGALWKGYSAWGKELDEFSDLIMLVSKPIESWTTEEKCKIDDNNVKLENFLNALTGKDRIKSIELSDSVTLVGEWVEHHLKPSIKSSEASGSVSLAIEFMKDERAMFSASIYSWLSRHAVGKLDPRCFPPDLLEGVKDARIRAAAKSQYAFDTGRDRVEMLVNTGGKGEVFRIKRVDNDVDVRT